MQIYETINHWNRENGILPYRYIGSDFNDRNDYFGSSRSLQEDISILGVEFFEKRSLLSMSVLTNVELRNLESKILIALDCAKDKTYYNKTNTSHKGFIETLEEKKARLQKRRDKFDIYISSMTKEERSSKIGTNFRKVNELRKDISIFEYYLKKYSTEIAEQKVLTYKKKISLNNGMKKYSDIQKQKVIELFELGYSKIEISELTNVDYGVIKIYCRLSPFYVKGKRKCQKVKL